MSNYLSDEQKQAIIDAAFEDLKAAIVAEAKAAVSYQVKYAVEQEATRAVTSFFEDELAAEIQSALVSHKDTIIEAAVVGANEMAQMLTAGMVKSLGENLSRSYSRKEILKAMFD